MTMEVDSTIVSPPPLMPADKVAQAVIDAAPAVPGIDVDQLTWLRQMESLGHQIKAKIRDLGKAETAVAEADAARKGKMDARNKVQNALDELHDELANLAAGKSTERLFPPQAERVKGEGDEAWRSVELSALTPAIKPAKLKAMRENEPSIRTVGDWADWCDRKGTFAVKDVKGFGEKGMDQITAALDAFWASNPQQSKSAAEKPSDAAPFDDSES